MSGACSTQGRREAHTQSWRKSLKGRQHLQSLGLDGRKNIKMDLQDLEWAMDWIDVDEDMKRWSAVVNAVMNLRFQ